MKNKTTILLSIICIIVNIGCTYKKTIELPITYKNGYGSIQSNSLALSPYSLNENNPWKKTHLNIINVPSKWSSIKIGDIETNIYQTVYQNYYLNNITKKWNNNLQKSWNWKPDSTKLSKKPIRTKIAFAYGKDSTGITRMIVDTNNNLDLSDDEIFTPLEYKNGATKNYNDSLALRNSITATYDKFIDNKIVQKEISIFITFMKQANIFVYNFHQYGSATLNNKTLHISSSNFTDTSYENPSVLVVNDSLIEPNSINNQNLLKKNEYFEIDNKTYKILEVNTNKQVLSLEHIKTDKNQIYSSQIGYKSFQIKGSDFLTKDTINLEKLKGKYVLLDFWATWCGPCIKEIPNLKELQRKVDATKFKIIGIVGDSSPESLGKSIEKHQIYWPQIISDSINNITKKFGVRGYPTTFLINPEGIIIAKDLRGEKLEEKILELLNKI